ncbi:hypothetical protein L596_014855 [Steinernema carpocapsae]|uniref:Uncharacterized protein n=1 Tax=Steinernema carpocapsae TaxID=34508 RepID=A0A4V6XW79_STECR|nr:hypothetical protein L596_014855 [Steinernema carpocapsae]
MPNRISTILENTSLQGACGPLATWRRRRNVLDVHERPKTVLCESSPAGRIRRSCILRLEGEAGGWREQRNRTLDGIAWILLEACCLYDNLLIHRRILDELLTLAARLKMAPVLRSLEMFILNSETIHPIRKFEYAAEFRMSRLADSVQRAFKSRIYFIDCLHELMRDNNESLGQMHPKVLQIMNIGASSIVIE